MKPAYTPICPKQWSFFTSTPWVNTWLTTQKKARLQISLNIYIYIFLLNQCIANHTSRATSTSVHRSRSNMIQSHPPLHHPPIRLQKSLLWTWMQALKPMLALTLARGKKVASDGQDSETNACPKSVYLLSMSINHQNTLYWYILKYVKLVYFLL